VDDETTYHPDIGHPYLQGADEDYPTVKALSGALKGNHYRLQVDEYCIGRDPASDIVIEDREVSRRHAMIMRKAGEYVLCDLDSTNGVYVNNLKLEKAILKHGDVFQIGSCVFQFTWRRNKAKS
jgi:pSer/pThr/pTyr-binding forkhead associated (FHA) protein